MVDKDKARDIIDDAAFKPTLGYHGSQARLSRMGFDVIPDEEQSKYPVLQHTHFSKTEGIPIGEIPIPKKVIQPEVDREQAKSMIDHHNQFQPIKVAMINGEHVVVDGHHRLAVAKALGKKNIKAKLVESANLKTSRLKRFTEIF